MYIIDDTEASLIIDNFTKLQSIQITKVAGSARNLFVDTFELTDQGPYIQSLYKLGFQFAFQDGSFFLRLKGKVSKSDIIHFLFENDKVIEKKISKTIFFHRTEYTETIELNFEEMKIFATTFLKKWKLTSGILDTFIIGGFMDYKFFEQYPTSDEGQYLLLLTARQLIKQVVLNFPNADYHQLLLK